MRTSQKLFNQGNGKGLQTAAVRSDGSNEPLHWVDRSLGKLDCQLFMNTYVPVANILMR